MKVHVEKNIQQSTGKLSDRFQNRSFKLEIGFKVIVFNDWSSIHGSWDGVGPPSSVSVTGRSSLSRDSCFNLSEKVWKLFPWNFQCQLTRILGQEVIYAHRSKKRAKLLLIHARLVRVFKKAAFWAFETRMSFFSILDCLLDWVRVRL